MSLAVNPFFFRAFVSFCIVVVFSPNELRAQLRTVDSGQLEFSSPPDMGIEEAKAWVLEQACIRAMANEFGVRVTSESVYSVADFNGNSEDAFTELNVSQVQGEWVRTLEEFGPDPFVKDGSFWWSVRVRGQAKPIRQTNVELDLTVVEDIEARIPVDFLKAGDRIRCAFTSSVDGYLLLFYIEKGLVYALSDKSQTWSVSVEGQKTYSLFTPDYEWREAGGVEGELHSLPGYDYGFRAINEGDLDVYGVLVAAFNTERFSPPIFRGGQEIPTVTEGDFDRWIKRNSGSSDDFQLERHPLRIKAKRGY